MSKSPNDIDMSTSCRYNGLFRDDAWLLRYGLFNGPKRETIRHAGNIDVILCHLLSSLAVVIPVCFQVSSLLNSVSSLLSAITGSAISLGACRFGDIVALLINLYILFYLTSPNSFAGVGFASAGLVISAVTMITGKSDINLFCFSCVCT